VVREEDAPSHHLADGLRGQKVVELELQLDGGVRDALAVIAAAAGEVAVVLAVVAGRASPFGEELLQLRVLDDLRGGGGAAPPGTRGGGGVGPPPPPPPP
jgi:hypothetical protein